MWACPTFAWARRPPPCPVARPSASSCPENCPGGTRGEPCTFSTNPPPACTLKTSSNCSRYCIACGIAATPWWSSSTIWMSSRPPTGSSTWVPRGAREVGASSPRALPRRWLASLIPTPVVFFDRCWPGWQRGRRLPGPDGPESATDCLSGQAAAAQAQRHQAQTQQSQGARLGNGHRAAVLTDLNVAQVERGVGAVPPQPGPGLADAEADAGVGVVVPDPADVVDAGEADPAIAVFGHPEQLIAQHPVAQARAQGEQLTACGVVEQQRVVDAVKAIVEGDLELIHALGNVEVLIDPLHSDAVRIREHDGIAAVDLDHRDPATDGADLPVIEAIGEITVADQRGLRGHGHAQSSNTHPNCLVEIQHFCSPAQGYDMMY